MALITCPNCESLFEIPEYEEVKDTVDIYVDGSMTAVAVVLPQTRFIGSPIIKLVFPIEKSTVNEGEYRAVLEALREAKERGLRNIRILGDSQLVIYQLLGRYVINEPRLQALADQVWGKVFGFDHVRWAWTPREYNKAGKLLP